MLAGENRSTDIGHPGNSEIPLDHLHCVARLTCRWSAYSPTIVSTNHRIQDVRLFFSFQALYFEKSPAASFKTKKKKGKEQSGEENEENTVRVLLLSFREGGGKSFPRIKSRRGATLVN